MPAALLEPGSEPKMLVYEKKLIFSKIFRQLTPIAIGDGHLILLRTGP